MLRIVPIYQKEANAFVKRHHEHHKPVVGSIFQIAVEYVNVPFLPTIVAVAIVGRPVARRLDNKRTVEVLRLCTDRLKRYHENGKELNPCSMLYAATWRVAKNMGYDRLITYILNTEPGTSVKAAGWTLIGERGGGSWSVPSRPRVDTHPIQPKLLFEITN
jgi:hypothetical protein